MDPWLQFPWRRFWFWWLKCLGTLCLSTFFVLLALGYRWNAQARVFQATAVLEVGTLASGQRAEVFLNGQSYGTQLLPWRQAWLTPGTYDIELRADGYQSVQSRVELLPGGRHPVRNLVLRYEELVLDQQVATSESIPLRFTVSKGEVYDEARYLARLSGDVVLVAWLPGTEHLVLRQGSDLLLLNTQRGEVVPFIQLPETATALSVSSDGRLLQVTTGDTRTSYALWEEIPLTRRLAGYR